jgi:mono/diheme cytochrome c family protein
MQEVPRCETDGTFAGQPCTLAPPEGTVSVDEPASPPPLTRELVDRGRDRFMRFCAPCHGVAGDGDSYVARAMTLRKPPTLVDAEASRFSDNRILDVIATGYGTMPSYAVIPIPDRHAITTYLRVLQSREVPLAELSAEHQREAKRWLP